MLACDFFHGDCAVTLRRIYVFFVLEVASRCWARPQTPDRAGQFTTSFDAVLADVGIQVVTAS